MKYLGSSKNDLSYLIQYEEDGREKKYVQRRQSIRADDYPLSEQEKLLISLVEAIREIHEKVMELRPKEYIYDESGVIDGEVR